MKNNRLESIITQSLERFYSRLMPILNSKQPKESGKGLTKNDLTDELKGKYDEAVNMSHGHANKNILDNTNASFTTALKSNYDDAVNKSHTHSNKTILDNTNESFTTDIKTQINMNKSNISIVADYINDSDLITDSESKMVKTVPTNANHACGISMIGGKTVKTKNLLKPQNDLKEATVNGITFTPVFDSNGHLEYVTANGTATDTATFIISKLKEDISGYILSLGLSQESVSYRVACALSISPWTTYQNIIGSGEKTIPSITYTDTIDVDIHVLKDTVANNVKFYPMLRKPGTSGTYEPYHEELWNTPVESVVSVGKNILNIAELLTDSTSWSYISLQLKPNTTYTVSSSIDNISKLSIYAFNSNGAADGNTNQVSISIPRQVTTNSDGIVKIQYKLLDSSYSFKNYTYQIEEGSEATEYSPYNKTTLSIPEAIKSLPDYGCAVSDTIYNYVDFENGVYHHVVGSVDLGDLNYMAWEGAGLGGARLFVNSNSPLTDKKAGLSNIICAPYTTSIVSYEKMDSGYIVSRYETTYAPYIYIRDATKTSNVTVFKNGLKGQKLLYELATEELIDISDILHPIRCEAGGTITFNNEHSLDMPNTVVYKKEVSLS